MVMWVPEKSSMLMDMLINSFISLWVGCVKQEADSAFLGALAHPLRPRGHFHFGSTGLRGKDETDARDTNHIVKERRKSPSPL